MIEKVSVPEGKSGAWSVERFTVSKNDSAWSFLTGRGRGTPPGEYTGLYRGRSIIMSDTPDEMRDHFGAVWRAHGHCLINGLGLGMVLQAVAKRPQVERVTVIESSPDVLALVADHYREMFGDKVEIIQSCAYEWKPPKGARYGMVWHDIWDSLCGDNLPLMTKLHRKYGRRCEWQGSWGREWIRRHA